jgi:cell division protein FtsZ
MGTINERMDSNAEIIFGTTSDSTLEKDEVKITIVATGFESKNDEVEETTEGNEESSNQNNNVLADSENYFDTPPLMRDYIVQYQLN